MPMFIRKTLASSVSALALTSMLALSPAFAQETSQPPTAPHRPSSNTVCNHVRHEPRSH